MNWRNKNNGYAANLTTRRVSIENLVVSVTGDLKELLALLVKIPNDAGGLLLVVESGGTDGFAVGTRVFQNYGGGLTVF